MSKNRMIVEEDRKGGVNCQVTSSTHGSKTRTNVLVNKGKYYMKQNNFQDVRKFEICNITNRTLIFNHSTGCTSCHNFQSHGNCVRSRDSPNDWHRWPCNDFICSVSWRMCSRFHFHSTASTAVKLTLITFWNGIVIFVFTWLLFVRYLGNKLRQKRFFGGPKKTAIEEAREVLATTILSHVPVRSFFSPNTKVFSLHFLFNRWRILTLKLKPCTLHWWFVE